MAKFLDILPDPEYKISDGGLEDSINGTAGQGFAALKLSQYNPVQYDRTITGRLVSRKTAHSKWMLDVRYNPMTKEEFRPVYSFLINKKNSLVPFYIALPQYKLPKNTLFSAFVESTSYSNTTVNAATAAGTTTLVITNSAWSGNDYSTTGLPTFGDIFTITDSSDSLHTKMYMISRVETFATYESQPPTGTIRLHITPGLQRKVASGSVVNFSNPLLKVVNMSDIQEYSLGNDNLYEFSLRLEEALY